jgi:hypothetical protein
MVLGKLSEIVCFHLLPKAATAAVRGYEKSKKLSL